MPPYSAGVMGGPRRQSLGATVEMRPTGLVAKSKLAQLSDWLGPSLPLPLASWYPQACSLAPPGLSFLTWEREPDRVGEIEYQPVNEAQGM